MLDFRPANRSNVDAARRSFRKSISDSSALSLNSDSSVQSEAVSCGRRTAKLATWQPSPQSAQQLMLAVVRGIPPVHSDKSVPEEDIEARVVPGAIDYLKRFELLRPEAYQDEAYDDDEACPDELLRPEACLARRLRASSHEGFGSAESDSSELY